MFKKIFRQIFCVVLAGLQFGCSNPYKLNLHTQPSGALVSAGTKVYGQTPCTVKISRNSPLIKDKHIEFTYLFDDGRSIVKSYNLGLYEPPSKLAEVIAAVLIVPGALLISLTQTDEDDRYTSIDKEDSTEQDREIQLIGAGLIGLGALVYYVFGGDEKGSEGYDIYETITDFDIP